MIGATKRLLIETLLDLALGEDIDIVGGDLTDHIRALFLLASSHSILFLPLAERISYETYVEGAMGSTGLIRGLAVAQSEMLLSDVVDSMMRIRNIPQEMARYAPNLKYEDFQAALYAIFYILVSLEWDDWMEKYSKRHSPDQARKSIMSSLRALRSYRETGEP